MLMENYLQMSILRCWKNELEFTMEYKDSLGFTGASVVKKTQVLSLGQEDSLEQEMATHSSILAWEISWTEEPGGLQSMGSQKSQTQLSNSTAITTNKEALFFKSLILKVFFNTRLWHYKIFVFWALTISKYKLS